MLLIKNTGVVCKVCRHPGGKKISTKEIYLYQFQDNLDLILQCDVILEDLDFLYLGNGKVDFFSSHNSSEVLLSPSIKSLH